MPDPTAIITGQLIRHLERPHFKPFVIVTSDGGKHRVPTRDHLTITRLLRLIVLEHDDGTIEEINPLHITRITAARDPARAA
ncbi:MAG: hypothetical protein HZA93_15015 [Verrucomicrobia bacterium]|nr:hypothetical protein [Verrucomicrobiota bacterium]